MGISMSDKLRFATIERLIVDTIKDLPDGWDYITHMSLLKAEHEVAEDLRSEIKSLKDEIDGLESELCELEHTVRSLECDLYELEDRRG